MANMVMSPNQQYNCHEQNISRDARRAENNLSDVQIYGDGRRTAKSDEQYPRREQARSYGASDSESERPDCQHSDPGKVLNKLIALSESRVKRLENQVQEEIEYGGQLKEVLQQLQELVNQAE
jgi:hypothetical protein